MMKMYLRSDEQPKLPPSDENDTVLVKDEPELVLIQTPVYPFPALAAK